MSWIIIYRVAPGKLYPISNYGSNGAIIAFKKRSDAEEKVMQLERDYPSDTYQILEVTL